MDENSQYSTLPPKVWNLLKARSETDPSLERLKDISAGVQAAPVIAGAAQAGRALGGGAINVNPLLAWASGLPGAPKNLGAIAQSNPYVSPTETIQKLMGMGISAGKTQSDYLKERDKFFATQMGRPVGAAGANIEKDLMKEREIYAPRRAEERQNELDDARRRRQQRIADILDAEERKKAQRADKYIETVEDWESENISPYVDPLENITEMLDTNPNIAQFSFTNPFTGNTVKLPKNLVRDFVTSPEEQAFYSELEAVISQIRHKKYGTALTATEAKNAMREFGMGNITKMQVLKGRLNQYKQRMLRDLEQKQLSGSRRYGEYFTDYYDSPYNTRLESMIDAPRPKKRTKSRPQQKTAPAPAPVQEEQSGIQEESLGDDVLDESLKILKESFGR